MSAVETTTTPEHNEVSVALADLVVKVAVLRSEMRVTRAMVEATGAMLDGIGEQIAASRAVVDIEANNNLTRVKGPDMARASYGAPSFRAGAGITDNRDGYVPLPGGRYPQPTYAPRWSARSAPTREGPT